MCSERSAANLDEAMVKSHSSGDGEARNHAGQIASTAIWIAGKGSREGVQDRKGHEHHRVSR